MFSGLVLVGKEYLWFQCFLRKHGEMPPVTAANKVDFEMEHDAADPTPSEPVNPIVPGNQPRWFGSEQFVEGYAGCVEQFPGGKNFMDEFRNDRYAEERRQNLYFSWASRREWAFASWLLRSRLSMAAIDSLLSLELVSNSLYIRCIAFNYASDKRSFVVLSFCEGITCSCRDAACWPAMAMWNISPRVSYQTASPPLLLQPDWLLTSTS